MAASDLPIGAILPYAGGLELEDMEATLASEGWFVLNGSVAHRKQCPELYNLLHPNDKDPPETFNLPNLEGMFLRGYDPGGKVDQGVADRYDPTDKSSNSKAVGSKQDYSTSFDGMNFQSASFNAPTGITPGWGRFFLTTWIVRSGQCCVPLAAADSNNALLNFPAESRPKNIYVLYIIKYLASAVPPIGAIAQYAVTPVIKYPDVYLPCDGTAYSKDDYPDLKKCMHKAYGMDGANFKVPNYLGRFFRGLDPGRGFDPDWSTRKSAATPPRKGNTNGTTQCYDTGRPVADAWLIIPMAVDTPGVPLPVEVQSPNRPPASSGWAAANTDAESIIPATVVGGAKETRPANIAVESHIQAKAVPEDAPGIPVGTIIAWLAEDISSAGSNWAECNGTNGAPDLSGQFLRNVSGNSGLDPDAAGRTLGNQKGDLAGSSQQWATANGSTPLAIKWKLPTEQVEVGNDGGGDVNGSGFGATSYPLTGGDAETRPVNIWVKFLIRTG